VTIVSKTKINKILHECTCIKCQKGYRSGCQNEAVKRWKR